MKVLIGCEYSGIMREEFRKLGHDAWSCDLLPSRILGNHYKCDIRELDLSKFDLLIAHPPCTHLAISGARWFSDKKDKQEEALVFVKYLMDAPIQKICIENPVSIISTKIRKPDQIIHPWQFGEDENKTTCLWLKNLPKLIPTEIIPKVFRDNSCHYMSPSKNRGLLRSKTYLGIAQAMASQWNF